MKRSKKGITLVELVITCAIIVLLGGACTSVLVSGQSIFNTSTKSANAQLDADVLQTYLMNLLPPSKNINKLNSANEAKDQATGNYLYFNDGQFTLRSEGKDTVISSVTEFAYSVVPAGDPTTSTTVRAQLQYTITLTDGSTLEGGFVMGNVAYDASTMASITGNVHGNPLSFNDEDVPDPTEPAT